MNFKKVIFLDIDRVLHPDVCGPESNFCCLPNFCSMLRHVDPEHQIPVVISSIWRHYNTLPQMRDAFPPDIACQIVGVTPYMSPAEMEAVNDWDALGGEQAREKHRQREILLWMRNHAAGGQWLAIDDRPEYFFDDCPNLFVVPRSNRPGVGGITTDIAFELLARMNLFLYGEGTT